MNMHHRGNIVTKFITKIGVTFIEHKEALCINNNKTTTKRKKKRWTSQIILSKWPQKILKMCSNQLFIKGMQSKNERILLFTYKKSWT